MYLKMIVLFLVVSLAVTNAGIPGGIVNADINDADVQKALRFAVAQYNRQSNEAFVRKVTKVIRVQQQVVAGMNYIFIVKLGIANCKNGVKTICAPQKNPKVAQVIQCKITVWSQPWLDDISVTENTCL
ncbi:cystatin-like [Carassius carassius]|uniref:cystatin-like n=1 Tax=Carassius carassius TaxID=217509 RepID=UPI0028690D30|nr:cystatin-like [Carassius carassius]XP_059358715.1 cystatin-like [Carassius carassius]XP_059358716.1 cystatin-like [Carassius carassius]